MPVSGMACAPPPPEPGGHTRLLPTYRLGGTWQMAIDSWLLDRGGPALRLYRWQRPCLSLGLHQRHLPAHWQALAASGALELVRRPSGGQAVLHGGDLTYALVWPDPPRDRIAAYRLACGWLQAAFAALGQPLVYGTAPASLAGRSCFASSTAADLVHPHSGEKRIGSAQLWRGGRLLQHGSIQLNPDPELWRQLFDGTPPTLPPLPVDAMELEQALLAAAATHLPLPPLAPRPLLAAELATIATALGPHPGDSPSTTQDGDGGAVFSSSPEASIERTTWGRARPNG